MRLLAKKAGTVEKAVDKIQSKEMTEEAITMIGDVLELLISQGCAYKNLF